MKKGFTLIELLVSISILVILTGVGFASFGNFTASKQLRASANGLAAKLSETKARAYSGQKTDGALPNGYGVFVSVADPNRYIIYADKNSNWKFDAGDSKMEEVALGAKVKFTGLTEDFGACFRTDDDKGEVCRIDGTCGVYSAIIFRLLAGGQEKNISVNGKTGVIGIDVWDCPAPEHVQADDGTCNWNCQENSHIDIPSNTCLCNDGYLKRDYVDDQGRQVCGLIDRGL